MKITIRDKIVERDKKLMSVDEFCKLVQQHCVSGMRDRPIPDNVRWIVEQGDHAMYIVELQPELRTVLWECREWDEPPYALPFTIATPYVVLAVAFYRNTIQQCGVFYRNQPLQSIDDPLCFTNLRNAVGSEYDNLSILPGHLCLDGLKTHPRMDRETALGELVNHLWSGEFNDEIDCNGFNYFAKSGRDQSLQSIESWQQASLADPSFVLGVDWIPANYTVRGLIEQQFRKSGLGGHVSSSAALGNLILADQRQVVQKSIAF